MTLSPEGGYGDHTVRIANEGKWRHWVHVRADCHGPLLCYDGKPAWDEVMAVLEPGPAPELQREAERVRGKQDRGSSG